MSTHLVTPRRGSVTRLHSRSAPTASALYQSVTSRIIEAMERGVVPWRKPWKGRDSLPCNAVSKRQYHGINLFLLGLAPFSDHRWLTFRQAQELGGHIKKGEKSMLAVFWKVWELELPDEDDRQRKSVPLLRTYHLFNVEQCEELNLPPQGEEATRPVSERIQEAEALVRSMPDLPKICEGGTVAFYRPQDDLIRIPHVKDFDSPESYYATLFHELGHATGHETRLNRPSVTGTAEFGSSDYSREELVAELTSAFCCASIGIDNSTFENAASYIQGWLAALRGDPKALIIAAGQGQRAADYICGEHGEPVPL